MAITYPLAFPSARGLARVTLKDRVAVGVTESPHSFSQQVFDAGGDAWGGTLEFIPMEYADAVAWDVWRKSLRGQYGSFLMGPPKYTLPAGTWSGSSPLVNGAHTAGMRTLSVRGLADGKTWEAGDYLQVGSGEASRLHRVLADGAILGSPQIGYIDLWPALREDLADGDAIVISSPKGTWRLGAAVGSWAIDPEGDTHFPPLEIEEAL